MRLGLLFDWSNGEGLTKKKMKGGNFLVYGGNGITGRHNEFLVEKEAIIVGRVGANCGNVHIAKPYSWITDNAIYSKWKSNLINLKFILYLLNYMNLNNISGGSGQPYLSQPILDNVVIPICSTNEQKRIAEEVEYIDSIVESNERIISQNLTYTKKLLQSILKVAFEGKLVPQEPDDEPAEMLLQKIKNEKSGVGTASFKTKRRKINNHKQMRFI